MNTAKSYAGIDGFRMIAALLIVAIHIAPLSSYNETADFIITYCFGRIAVPFFLMVTGYFVLSRSLSVKSADKLGLKKYLKKAGALYGVATLLYLPVNIYAGHIDAQHWLGAGLRAIVFDGTFYHLWYLPASILGVLVLFF